MDAENEISKNHISPREYHGTHEMGHVMGSLLISGDGIRKGNIDSTRFVEQFKNKKAGKALDPAKADQGFSSMRNKFEEAVYNLPENDMIMDTIAKHGSALNKEYGKIGLSEHSSTGINKFGHAHLKNQLDTNSSQFFTKGLTSGYGSESAGEFFAEAVADVYSHGKNAKTMSKLLVQEYEGRQKNMVRSQFNKKKKRNWWHKLWGI